jgi:hypothetical protein
MALQELGISPEELMQALQGGGDAGGAGAMGGAAGGMGGAMPPPPPGGDMGGAGAPPMPPPGAMDQGAKIASAVKAYKRSGKFRFEEAKSAQQRAMRDQMKDYIRELTGNRI